MSNLKEVIISITNRCNSLCRMCEIPKEKTEELSTSQWKGVIEDACLTGASTIVFSGGEPLLRKDIFELISHVKNNNMTACITSNGLLIDEEKAKRLSQSDIDVVNISIEGPEKVHDYLRGEGSYRKAISALTNLKRYKIESSIAMMVSCYNYNYMDYIVTLADRFGATTIKFQPFSTLFTKDKSRENKFFISRKETIKLNRIIRKVESMCSEYGIATNPSLYLNKIPLYLSNEFFDRNGGCKALWSSCPINSRGEVYPCWALSEENRLIGSVREEKLSVIWNSEKHNFIRSTIKQKGCPGCMMSCYDEAFGRDSIKRKISLRISRVKKDGFFEYINSTLRRLYKKFNFYRSYRGGAKHIIGKARNSLRRQKLHTKALDTKRIREEILEIEEIKQRFKKEMEKCGTMKQK